MKSIKRPSFKLRTKFIISLLTVALLGIGVVGAVSIYNIYRFSRREVERNSTANLKSALDNTLDFILELRSNAIRPTIEPKSMTAVSELLTAGETSYENMFELQIQFSMAKAESGVDSLFFMNEERIITNERGAGMSFAYMMEQEWFSRWYDSDELYAWGVTYPFRGAQVLPYVRKILEQGQVIGVSVLNIKESAVRDCWDSYGNFVLVDKENNVLSSGEIQTIGDDFQEHYGKKLDKIPSGDSFAAEYQGERYDGVLYRDSVYGLGMVELLPCSVIQTVVTDMLESTLGVLVAVAFLCVALAVVLSNKITKPLKSIMKRVDGLKMDTLAEELPVTTNDEIGMLVESINNMMRRLEASKDEILRISDARRLAEYRAIQLQINPHFLYNTLSSVTWFADQNQPENVKKVAESLSVLFRISVNHGRELLHIVEEIQHVRCYLDIQMLRHKDEFIYQIDVEPEILSYYTIKIILQPLVENSLYHGIRENGITKGVIRIVGKRKGSDIELLVIDNGDISQEEIDRMNAALKNPDSREDSGIGMLNVHNRIRYFFQNGYGLRYEKRENLTIAHVIFPVIEEA